MRCTAKAKQRQAQCRLPAIPGMTVCRFHGGKTPRGSALPQFRTGRYSKFLPSRLVARYRAAAKDPEILSLRHELSLVDARINDLLSRVDTGESGAMWFSLRRAHRAFRRSRQLGDVAQMRDALARLEGLLDRGIEDYQAWTDVYALIDRRRKLVESEYRRLLALQQVVTAEQALLLIGAITDIITRHVPDRQVLAAVIAELQQIAAVGDIAQAIGDVHA